MGMPTIDKDKKWAVAINRKKAGKDRWKLIKLIKEGRFKFTDTDDETCVEVDVQQYRINNSEWWSFLVENNINRNIDINNEANAK